MQRAIARAVRRARPHPGGRACTVPGRGRQPAADREGRRAQSVSIAAASIVAKVERDAMMRECDQRYPGLRPRAQHGLRERRPPRGAAPPGAVRDPPPLFPRDPALAILTCAARLAGVTEEGQVPVKLKQDADKLEKAGKLDRGDRSLQAGRRRQPARLEHHQQDRRPLRQAQQDHGGDRRVREGRRLLREGRLPPEGDRDLEEDQQARRDLPRCPT